jgi:hypothetical protein
METSEWTLLASEEPEQGAKCDFYLTYNPLSINCGVWKISEGYIFFRGFIACDNNSIHVSDPNITYWRKTRND